MLSFKTRYYKYRELSFSDIRTFNSFLKRHGRAILRPSEIRPYKTDPSFKDKFGFWSWWMFARCLSKYAGKIRKYSLNVFPRWDRFHNHRIGWITVRYQEFAIADWSSDHYPSIELVNSNILNNHANEVFELIAEELHLELTKHQEYTDFIEQLQNSIQRSDVRSVVSAAILHNSLDLAVTGTIQLVESSLRKKCLDVGKLEAKELPGVDLAKVAYHEDQGCLIPPVAVAVRANHGAFVLTQGFFHYIRNSFMHNKEVLKGDYRFALPVIQFCEFLLSMIEESIPR